MANATEKYKKDNFDELFLKKFNDALAGLEKEYITAQETSDQPVVFVCGAPRSGTTLLTQVLAKTGLFNYVTNFVARFWRVPFVGLYLEKLMGIRNMNTEHTFGSHLGRTLGILGPHEFTYFWEYWLKPHRKHEVFSEAKLNEIDVEGFKKEINAMINIYGKPIVFKNMLLFANPGLMHKIFPNSYFVVIKRDILLNALSIYNARKHYYGNENEWFSTRPANYEHLKKQPVEVQIVGQIKGIYDEIAKQSKTFSERIITTTYEELCNDPIKTVLLITEHLGMKDIDINEMSLRLPRRFNMQSKLNSTEILKKFKKALKTV